MAKKATTGLENGFLPESVFAGTPSQDFADQVTGNFGESPVSPDEPGKPTAQKKKFDTANFATSVGDLFNQIFLGKDTGLNAALSARRAGEEQQAFREKTLQAQRDEAFASREATAEGQDKAIGAAERLEIMKGEGEIAAIQERGKVELGVQEARTLGLRGNSVISAGLAAGVDMAQLQGIDLNTQDGVYKAGAIVAPGIRRHLRMNLDAKALERAELRDASISQGFIEDVAGFRVIVDANGLQQSVPIGNGSARERALAVIGATSEDLTAAGVFLPEGIKERKDAWIDEQVQTSLDTNIALRQEFDQDVIDSWEATVRQKYSQSWDRAMLDQQQLLERGPQAEETFLERDNTPRGGGRSKGQPGSGGIMGDFNTPEGRKRMAELSDLIEANSN